MAPRRGGGGGGVFDVGVSVPACSLSNGIYIAAHVLFFIVYAILAGVAATRYLRSKSKGRSLLRWWALAVSMVFGLIQTILSIIFVMLRGCHVLEYSATEGAFTTITWMDGLSQYLLVAVILVPIIRRLHESAGQTAKLVTLVNYSYLGLLAIILVCWLGIQTFLATRSLVESDGLTYNLQRLLVAYYALEALAILMAGANMVVLLVRKSSYWRRPLKRQVLLLIVAALAMTLLDLAGNIDVFYGTTRWRTGYLKISRAVKLYLGYLFYSCTFAAACFVARSLQLSDNAAPAAPAGPVAAAYPPMGTGMQQPKYNDFPRPQSYQAQPHYQQNQPQPQWYPQNQNT